MYLRLQNTHVYDRNQIVILFLVFVTNGTIKMNTVLIYGN